MKKVLFLLLTALGMASCSTDETVDNLPQSSVLTPSTQVFVAGSQVKSFTDNFTVKRSTKAVTYSGETHQVNYYIRIDNNIPNEKQQYAPAGYFPQTFRKWSFKGALNQGTVKADYPYETLAGVRGIKEYVLDTRGIATKAALVAEPTLQNLIDANENNELNTYLSTLDLSKLKIIWYVVKNQTDGWHVDGVLTESTVTDLTDRPGLNIDEKNFMIPAPVQPSSELDISTPDPSVPEVTPPSPEPSTPSVSVPPTEGNYVKVDIHQQKHHDWEAIKTTIHVGAHAKDIEVVIPIGRENIAEKDDFAIRTYDAYYTLKVGKEAYKKVIAQEYNEKADVMVVDMVDYPGVLTAEQEAALAKVHREDVFVTMRAGELERMLYVEGTDLFQYNDRTGAWDLINNFDFKVQVSHEEDRLVIKLSNISPDIINAQTAVNPDGLTIEVFSYPRLPREGEDPEEYRRSVFEQLKQSTVNVTGAEINYSRTHTTTAADGKQYTQVSSAFFQM